MKTQLFVIIGKSARTTEVVVPLERVENYDFDTEHGEKVLTDPMTIEEVEAYLYGE